MIAALQQILTSNAVWRGSATPIADVREQAATLGPLPTSHIELLSAANGLSAYGGYFRVFSIEQLRYWNDRETWKFAWPDAVNEFLCFGETAWGDQYAYRVEDLRRAKGSPVYFLESLTLEPEQIQTEFDGFLVQEFLRNALEPYDAMIVAARERLGDLEMNMHVQYVPSPLITGEESVEAISKMPAVTGMVINGDLARQLRGEKYSRSIRSIDTYEDELGRTRLRVIW